MTPINLKELIEKRIIKETDATRKLTIHENTKNYKVYSIPIEYLHYNNKNGRIISSINRYESEGNILDFTDKAAYNNILQSYIIESNSKALDDTKKNIELFGQRLPGVVLNDGRVIDGNRRFTCIRLINAEKGSNLYFEAVILDQAEGLSDIDIKRLELNLQHAEERPVDYDPIDNLVEVYSVIVKDKLFSVEEYTRNTNKRKNEVEKMVKKSKLMVAFLKFINAEGKFYIARELNLDGPLQEIMGILSKEGAEETAEYIRVRDTLFTTLAIPHRGDLTRHIRDVGKNILKADNREEFLETYEDIVEEVYESFHEQEEVTKDIIREVNADLDVTKEESRKLIDGKIAETLISNIQDQPIDSLKRAIKTLESIDADQISRLDGTQKQEFATLLKKIEETMNFFGGKVGV